MQTKPKILMIGTDWGNNEYRKKHNLYGGVSYYRLIKPKQYLSEWYDIQYLGADIVEKSKGSEMAMFFNNLFLDIDLVIIKQIDNPHAASNVLFFAERNNIPVIMDLDDNFLEVRPDQPGYEVYRPGTQKRAFATAALSLSQGIFCSTKPLADYYQKAIKDIFKKDIPAWVLPNCNDIGDWKKQEINNPWLTIGWQGSITHFEDLKLITPILGKILDKYPNVRIEFMGGVTEEQVKDLFEGWSESALDRISLKGGTLAWEGYPELLASRGWDIGLAPLCDTDFDRGKSHIKWMEYASLAIPCVASRVYPYFEPIHGIPTIEDGKTGFLEDWRKNLMKLIESKKLREKIGYQAQEAIIKNWQYKDHIHKWKDAIDNILAQKVV